MGAGGQRGALVQVGAQPQVERLPTRSRPTYVVAYTRDMPPVTIYLPGHLIDAARKEARGRNRSLSAWIGGLVQDAVTTDWPPSFVDLLRRGGGDLVEPDDPPPEDIEPLR